MWQQVYDPFNNQLLSTAVASLPIICLLGLIAFSKVKAHIAAVLALILAFLVVTLGFTMPPVMAAKAAFLGAMTGLFPIGWIIINVIFLYRLTVENGSFAILQDSIANVTPDRRLQLLLVAFAFGAFFEGAAGFGTPVAVTGAILIGLGFSPLAASGLSLIANTAPVAFGALGAPVVTLAAVTNLDLGQVTAMVGRQLPLFSVMVPFWVVAAFAGFRGTLEVWPAVLITGLAFAIPQFLVSNFHGPWLVDVIAALVCMACLIGFLQIWQPKRIWTNANFANRFDVSLRPVSVGAAATPAETTRLTYTKGDLFKAWMPWLILCAIVFVWGTESFKVPVNNLFLPKFTIEGLHQLVQKVPPVALKPAVESAVFSFNILTMSGTGILLAGIISGFLMGFGPLAQIKAYGRTFWVVRYSLLTIAAMLALGTLTRYAGLDATLGLAFAGTGVVYPFFAALLGWLGVALTGSDTASNVLFGGLQTVTAQQLGLSPILMAAANSSGGVMGKMVDAQSIVVASTATNWFGHEGTILRFVFRHSIVLACLVGIFIMLQAYVYPFTLTVIH
ncbi:L-lactate permease [Beijerinckia indica]|uniref:L-lactate permease n=1 Tax=Beijerinckia indica subsp. indica (strain ATCC 9039 / DSM 1715 / NCIMB 8712) TaxID=395963 RepID=B2IF22_BEII9|nr:L-lactate permease [Beijerinckia indica]ACB94213.1 L-lactate transport [Beijerinckia indica subsp. indica ATCC 9039]